MIYVDIFVAGVGKWYEFRCEETEIVKNIIKEPVPPDCRVLSLRQVDALQSSPWKRGLAVPS